MMKIIWSQTPAYIIPIRQAVYTYLNEDMCLPIFECSGPIDV